VIVEGQCHCGNICFRLETSRAPAELRPRVCTCSFCSAHGAVYVADAAGRSVIQARNPEAMIRYRFAAKTTDFLVCKICGILVAALVDETRSAINLNLTEHRGLKPLEDQAWRSQSGDERADYRAVRWTPTRVLPGLENP
jgi:hypothetical protein